MKISILVKQFVVAAESKLNSIPLFTDSVKVTPDVELTGVLISL
jgi:hypothetical protein